MLYAGTLVDNFRPSFLRKTIVYDLFLIAGASIFIALSAQIAIRLPFSPVPITGQTFAVLLTGALLGSKRSSLAVFIYLFEGSLGLPVFAGAAAGIAHLAGPTGGYLLGFLPAAYFCGHMAEHKWDRNLLFTFFMMVLGTCIIFAAGLLWLLPLVGWENLFALGLFPFLPGALVKILLAAVMLPASWKLVGEE